MTNTAEKLDTQVDDKPKTAEVTEINKPSNSVAKIAPKAKAKPKTAKATKVNKEVEPPSVSTVEPESKAKVDTPAAKQPTNNDAKPKANKRFQKTKRPSKQEMIERQANPTTILAGKQKTINLDLVYASDIIHEYLQLNQSTMLSAYERIAGLLRMVSNDKVAYKHVSTWVNQNVQICQEQVKELQAQREAIAEDLGIDDLEISINTPDGYHTKFEASHPISHKMLFILRLVDKELNESESLFLGGLIDDEAYGKLRTQATTVIRGSVDRIFKATTPGVRNNGRYSPQELAGWIRQGNQLLFSDLPQRFEYIVNGE
jgi:hypothetical protein